MLLFDFYYLFLQLFPIFHQFLLLLSLLLLCKETFLLKFMIFIY